MRCILLSTALDDLAEIGRYIAQDNPTRAASYVDEIEKHCQRIAQFPHMGTPRSEIAVNLYSIPHGSYLIFYSIHTDEIHIEHVLHGARDIERFFVQ